MRALGLAVKISFETKCFFKFLFIFKDNYIVKMDSWDFKNFFEFHKISNQRNNAVLSF